MVTCRLRYHDICVCIKASGNKKPVSITMDAEALLLSDYSAFEVNPVTE
jgi:hypothetical protein